jgi:hypothetical protein
MSAASGASKRQGWSPRKLGWPTVPIEVTGKPSVVILMLTEGDQLAIRFKPK